MTRLILTTTVALVALNLVAAIHDHNMTANASHLTWRQQEIIHTRGLVHACQTEVGLRRSRVSQTVVAGGPAYRAWVLRLWRTRLRICTGLRRQLSTPVGAILAVFGARGGEAIDVAQCESHLHPWAQNGQYLGLFQMGSNERALYGHGDTPLEQARAAHRYFVASGSDWSPWSCQP